MYMKTKQVRLPKAYLDAMDSLVKQRKYTNPSAVIRCAVKELLESEGITIQEPKK